MQVELNGAKPKDRDAAKAKLSENQAKLVRRVTV